VTVGDIVSLTVRANALVGGSESVSYIVPSGATTTTIATGLKSAIAADSKLVRIWCDCNLLWSSGHDK
jgi:hypothetical protein